MKLSYTDDCGQKQTYPHDFASVREAVYVAANTGYILDSKELHITAEAAAEAAAEAVKKPAKPKAAENPEEAADGKDETL
jgi:hypothetical protein